MINLDKKNTVYLSGKVNEQISFSHESFKEKFYTFKIEIERKSGVKDILPIMISEKNLNQNLIIGEYIEVKGSLRSHNIKEGQRKRLHLSVLASSFEVLKDSCDNENCIGIIGHICKTPIYRKTPMGREITDIIVATNRTFNKSDYLPIVVWGKDALIAKDLNIGDYVKIDGRIQSRYYDKIEDSVNVVKKIALEVSCYKIEKLEENETEDLDS